MCEVMTLLERTRMLLSSFSGKKSPPHFGEQLVQISTEVPTAGIRAWTGSSSSLGLCLCGTVSFCAGMPGQWEHTPL